MGNLKVQIEQRIETQTKVNSTFVNFTSDTFKD